MDANNIRQLLDRYFQSETTRAEEALLKDYFQQSDIPADLAEYRPLFNFWVQERQQQTSADFNQKMARKPSLLARRSPVRVWQWAAAAAIFIAVGSWYLVGGLQKEPPTAVASIDWSKYEPQTDEEALRMATKALIRTSSALKQSVTTATQEIENVRKLVQPLQ
ncbi:MAG: hypothetical protein R2795_23765 [Saprospiraceae bacterium]